MAGFFFIASYLRRLLQALIILGLIEFGVLPPCLLLLLNLFYISMFLAFQPFEDSSELRYEIQNECVLLATLEFMFLFTGQFLNGEQREKAGIIIVTLVCLNFVFNLYPMLLALKQKARHLYYKCKRRRMQKISNQTINQRQR